MRTRYLLALLLAACTAPPSGDDAGGADTAAEVSAPDASTDAASEAAALEGGPEAGRDAAPEAMACGAGMVYCPAHGPDGGNTGFDAGCTDLSSDINNCGACGVVCAVPNDCVTSAGMTRCCHRGGPGCP